MGLHQTLCKASAQQMRQQSRKTTYEWEKIFTNHTSVKELIPQICKEFKQVNNGTNNQIKKWAKEPEKRHTSKDI